MALPDVKNRILDGAMGVQGASATGRFAAVGVAANYGQGLLTFTDAEAVEEALGEGPLRDLLVSSLSSAKTTVYAIALQGSVAGTLSSVTAGAENAGAGTVAVSGSPRNEYDIVIEILSSGTLNEGTFRVVIDGLAGKRLTIPDEPGTYEIAGTGITLTFAGTFAEGDIYSFSATEPSATNGEMLSAVDQILDAKLEIEWIAVAGVSSAPLWAALATKAEGAAEIFQYLFFVAQARYKAKTETLDQWANALSGVERGTVASTRLQVCAGWIEEADANGQIDVRGLIGMYCGVLAGRKVHQGPDAVRYGSISAATALRSDGINDGHIEALKDAGYVTARQIIGLSGIYITSGQMMAEEGSDYNLVERRRVMDKACRLIRKAQLFSLNDAVRINKDGSPEGIKMLLAQSEGPLKVMVTEGEISSGTVVAPEGQNILSTATLKLKVRIVPLGKLSYIENETAYNNPILG
ncbi:MAG: DUF2586 domain-containing protein [Spirochaetaceae bacterium]|jgi:hypothetical protein|nr:DUF2586 domain-containing protein [Spirochaetaceae bacterium]